jgi:hypothetical protein
MILDLTQWLMNRLPRSSLWRREDNRWRVLLPHLFARGGHCGENGFQIHQYGFNPYREQVLIGIVSDRQDARYPEQFGAYRVGTAQSGEASLLHHSRDPHEDIGDHIRFYS